VLRYIMFFVALVTAAQGVHTIIKGKPSFLGHPWTRFQATCFGVGCLISALILALAAWWNIQWLP